MHDIVAEYLYRVQRGKKLTLETEHEIVCGRVSLKVFPHVEADEPERLRLEFPSDMQPDEAVHVMAFKATLVGAENLPDLLDRINRAADSGEIPVVKAGEWLLTFDPLSEVRAIDATPAA